MKIAFAVSPNVCIATLAALTAMTTQPSPSHGAVSSVAMVLAGIVCGRLMNSGTATPAA
jgi:putative effector of murein hydrolase